MAAPAWMPVSTYRLQLGPDLTFAQVEALVPYFCRLGIEALYLSPMLKARPGSTHGYDIVDHAAINPDLGTDDDLTRLASVAAAHGLRLLSDIVPNHMGVDPQANPWWREVLENGPCSPYAEYFDIDWEPVTPHLRQKVLLPILGDQYGTVLERGELRVEYEDGRLWLCYYEHRLPINPRQTPLVLRHALPPLRAMFDESHQGVIEFLSILEGLHNLPPYTDTHPERIAVRQREKEVLRGRLLRLVEDVPLVVEAIGEAIAHVNGTPGSPASYDELHGLLEAQPYRLASWRTAVDEINYRRFFDVNELAGVRVEHEAVFQATHQLIGRWLSEGLVHALRLDHPDGLFDPPAYFARLQQLARDATGREAPLYVVAEKILSGNEGLRPDWQVHGTTGYGALNEINGLFLDPAGLRALRRLYVRTTGQRDLLEEIVYDAKKLIINTAMSSELGVLTDALARIARSDRHTRDFTLNSLRDLLAEFVACMPAYRTYVGPRGWTEADEDIIDRTLAEAQRRNPAMERSLFQFLRTVLLPTPPAEGATPAAAAMRERRLTFAMKLQQYTGPVQAKGFEDTTFYRYNLLVSMNEVGGEPGHAAAAVDDVHATNIARQQHWHGEMTTLSTHDTKLGEDVRARINAISEMPDAWREAVGRATRASAAARTLLRGGTWAPDRNDEYRFFQVLVGCWPPDVPVQAPAPRALAERLKDYMLKAIREAKRHTSWVTQNDVYEQATLAFVDEVLTGAAARRMLAALRPLVERLATRGASNALAQTALKLTLPGVPDTYQGTESWKWDLVDPDNRRPVSFAALDAQLAALDDVRRPGGEWTADVARWRDEWPDGRIKLHIASALLRDRRARPGVWREGAYRPLVLDVTVAATAMAFARVAGAEWAVVATALRTGHLAGAWPIGSTWATSRVLLPAEAPDGPWRDLLTGQVVQASETSTERWWFLAQVLHTLPVAVLVPGSAAGAEAACRVDRIVPS